MSADVVSLGLSKPRPRCAVAGCSNPPRFFGLYGRDLDLCAEHFDLHADIHFERTATGEETLRRLAVALRMGPPRELFEEHRARRQKLAQLSERLGLARAPGETDDAFEQRLIKRDDDARLAAWIQSREFLQSFQWRQLRMLALKRYGARCQCCGASAAQGAVMNVDHIKPRKTHPELALDIENLQVLCDACNHGKGNWDSTDWRST